jgi:predicted lipid-binding transport protein (Tim44 family)
MKNKKKQRKRYTQKPRQDYRQGGRVAYQRGGPNERPDLPASTGAAPAQQPIEQKTPAITQDTGAQNLLPSNEQLQRQQTQDFTASFTNYRT